MGERRVIEDGKWTASESGAPQGASASPLLANVDLHYVLDRWVRQWRCRRAKGDVIITRFADDFVAGFEHKADAEQFLADLRERFAKFGCSCIPTRRGSSSSGAVPPALVRPEATGSPRRSTS